MAVLLIGSTGNGKSTLGNFLLDPDSPKPKYFQIANTIMPQTQHTESKCKLVGSSTGERELIVIDTPGLNESKSKDLSHMIGIINTLQQVKTIRACIFVVKFSSKIDQQYKDTVEYYSRLLPSLFDKNTFIVVTEYQTDDRSEKMRKRQGIDEEVIINIIKREIGSASQIAFTPMVFSVDCLPFDDSELQRSKGVRENILSYIYSLDEVNVQNLEVAKTKALMEEDEQVKMKFEGQVNGYKQRLVEANRQSKDALDKMQKKEKEVTNMYSELSVLENRVREKDSFDPVSVSSWSIDNSWKILQAWQSQKFSLHTTCGYNNVRTWSSGGCKINKLEKTEWGVSGIVEGKLWRGLYANVTLEAPKKVRYKKEIAELRRAIELKKEQLALVKESAADNRKFYDKFKEEIDLLERVIEESRAEIRKLSSDTLPLAQAQIRLQTLLQKLC